MTPRTFIIILFVFMVWGAIKASQPTPLELAASIPIPQELVGK